MLIKLKNWYSNLGAKSDPLEAEQAKIRVPAVFVLLSIVFFSHYGRPITQEELIAYLLIATYAILGFSLLYTVTTNKFKPRYRKLFGAWIDIVGATSFMALTSDVGVMLVGFCLWVIFGNGFRYGIKYLYHAQILTIVGFLIASNISEYWLTHKTIGYSLLFMLIVLPLYVAKLINRLQDAIHKEEIERQKAAEANAAKTRFVANMSHEIRTPLNGIIGISTLFKSTPLNADQKDLLKTLESSSKLLLSLLNNVLDFTKIEERKLHIEKAAFSIEEAVYETVEIFRSQSNAKNVHLGASVSNTLGPVVGDPMVLRQVLANLLGNAIKFTEQGSVTISAVELQQTEQQYVIRFEVADTGVGIPEDKQDKVFQSFTQADAATNRKFGGSGLGLTIAKDMVEAMEGELKFQSTENVGTRFWFDLSLPKVIENSPSFISEDAIADQGNTSIMEAENVKLNILVCEDELTNQKIITRLLTLPGHTVEVVDNSEEMLDLLDSQHFDLVITDLNMAGMSGIEALKLYRFTKPTDDITKFILFTADVTLETKEEANNAGFNSVLTKPIEAATLFNTIEQTLNLTPNIAKYWMSNVVDANKSAEVVSDLTTDNLAIDLNTLQELEKIAAGDQLFMHRLLKNYLADSLKMLNQITDAVKKKHFGELKDYCHALKGNSLSVGALQIAESVDQLSKLSASDDFKKSQEKLNQVNKDFSKLTLAIDDYLRRPEVATNQH